jgi:hypothetical protein
MVRNLDQLGAILRRMYEDAPSGEQVARIHLFGIKYAADIRGAGFNAREVVGASGLKQSYHTEVNKGMNLSRYVVPLPEYAD